ncbi:hypothetical protein H2199_001011 [Coniosporium tulheliwenetii]|uniref:Uncharacterized protein n=1 Tax=Coniosporium tulheliwenetii TaxID=3383036 RepID=A0ACC2ZNL3_9PEZI|nr:hypothetical protein H2199_001011 [Cladosporium sp. JES 115]
MDKVPEGDRCTCDPKVEKAPPIPPHRKNVLDGLLVTPLQTLRHPSTLYLVPGNENTPYCHTCGRIISDRKSHAKNTAATPAKYCSSRCRSHKPGPTDRKIEEAFVMLLNGEEDVTAAHLALGAPPPPSSGKRREEKRKKGERRIVVQCQDVETLVFGSRVDPEKTYGRKKNRAKREWRSVDMVSEEEGSVEGDKNQGSTDANKAVGTASEGENAGDTDGTAGTGSDGEAAAGASSTGSPVAGDEEGGVSLTASKPEKKKGGRAKLRPPQYEAEVNGSIGGEISKAERQEESAEVIQKRLEGQRKAEEREMVRRAARRGCAFGFVVGSQDGKDANGKKSEERRKCEAIMNDQAVEASYAKESGVFDGVSEGGRAACNLMDASVQDLQTSQSVCVRIALRILDSACPNAIDPAQKTCRDELSLGRSLFRQRVDVQSKSCDTEEGLLVGQLYLAGTKPKHRAY